VRSRLAQATQPLIGVDTKQIILGSCKPTQCLSLLGTKKRQTLVRYRSNDTLSTGGLHFACESKATARPSVVWICYRDRLMKGVHNRGGSGHLIVQLDLQYYSGILAEALQFSAMSSWTDVLKMMSLADACRTLQLQEMAH
jgi:hypothetical protein